jgi:sigma-B regulation protein RsbU (phosphoserine phosphatase)
MSPSPKKFRELFSQSTWAGLLLVAVAALTLEATSLIQYYFSVNGLQEEASKRAETQLESTRNKIMDVIDQAESAVRNSVWIAQWCLNVPDSLPRVSTRIVEDNPVVLGSTIALVPGYNPILPLYAPYVYKQDDSLRFQSLASPEYDYPAQEWFAKPIELDSEFWSEPYIDTGGGEVLMTTFSRPIKDLKGRTAAVLTADISLDWLTDLLESFQVYPHARNLMISRSGRFMVSKTRELVVEKTVMEVVDQVRDHADFKELRRAMLAGESGKLALKYQGKKHHVFFAPVERTGWSMCIVIPEDDIYGDIRRASFWVKLLQLLGLVMLALILRSFVKNQVKYRNLDKRRELMEGELRIASGIQMSMVPKVFPPFPERHDLDMAATIVPAKEVGGDLYDFFIRDEKLFFCIGDVSGKGIPASLVMAVTRTSFRNVAAREDSPGSIVTSMNDSLAAMNENNMFVTFFCGVLDLAHGRLRYCNAGHNPPMTLTDTILSLPVQANLPLGIAPGMEFIEQEMDFHYDDALFLYTDGLSEAENSRQEQFGEQRIVSSLHGRKPAEDHLENIKRKVSEFVGDAPQSDDLTMLFIHYLARI